MPDTMHPHPGFQYGLANLKPAEPEHESHPHLPRRRQTRISQGHHRPRYRQGHLALAGQAHGGDGARRRGRRPRRSDRTRCENRIHRPRGCPRAGTDPARRRPRAGRSGAGAVARHAGDDRPRDRERLLLRLLPQRAVHAGGFRRDREEDARDHRARQTLHQGSLGPREDQAGVPRQGRELQGRAGRRHSRRRADQDLLPGRLVRSVPRAAHDLDRQGRQRLQADEGRRRLLARRQQQPDADAHLRHRVRQAGRPRRLSASRSRKPRSATIAGSAANSTCSTSRRKVRASCSGTPRAGRSSRR